MPDFDTRAPQEPNQPNRVRIQVVANKLRTLFVAARPRIVLLANRVRKQLIANRLRTLLISGGILLLMVAVLLGPRIYSSIEMGNQQQKLAGGAGVAHQPEAPNEDPTDAIAFIYNADLAVIDADGTGMIILTHNSEYFESNYDWSPDGQKILFNRYDPLHGNDQLRVINADGTGEEILTRMPNYAAFVWSPGGDKIAIGAANRVLAVIDADGTGRRKLTYTGVSTPSFSPDGEKIAFVMNEDVYVIGADGNGLKNLTHTTADEYSALWSPSDEKIAFVRARTVPKGQAAYTVYDLYVMNSDGTGKTLVAKEISDGFPQYGVNTIPTFSPDGKKIAFVSEGEIYVTNTDGTGRRKLTDTPSADESMPAWSPDGEKIAFKRCCENAREVANAGPKNSVVSIVGIYVMNADGTGERKLTDTPLLMPIKIQWRPVE